MSSIYLKIDFVMIYMKIACLIIVYMKAHSPFVERIHFY